MLKLLLMLVVLVSTGLSAQAENRMNKGVQVSQLTNEDSRALSSDRQWVNDLLKGFGSDVRLTKSRKDIPILHSLLDNGPFTSDASGELVVFGTVYGDVLAQEIGLNWVIFTDEFGSDYALQYQNKKVFVFPRDMLIKRIERGESPSDINLDAMLREISDEVSEQVEGLRS